MPTPKLHDHKSGPGQAASSSDSDEEDFLPIKRTAQQRSKRIEEEEEEEEGFAGKALGRQAKKARVSGELLSLVCSSVSVLLLAATQLLLAHL